MIKKYRKEIIFFYACCILSLIAGTFFDLELDIRLNNPTDTFSVWFYNTGEIPARLVCPIAGAVICFLCEKRITKIAGALICLGGSVYLGIHIAKYFFVDENKMIFGILYGLGVGIIILTVGQYIKIPGVAKKPLIAFAFAGIAVMFAEISIVELAKYTWARPRFRYLLQLGSYDRFTPWYRPLGFNFDEGNNVKSFPSGHSAGGAVSYLAMLLPFCTEKLKDKTLLCFAVPFVYTSTLAYTRMVMGAHFLTDVTVGGMITFTLIIIATAILDKKHYALKEH